MFNFGPGQSGKSTFTDSLKSFQHEHQWEPQYSTGTSDTKWIRDGKIGFGKSMVFKCECGKWSVKHYGDDVHVLLD